MSNIDLTIFFMFLFFTLAIGTWAGRNINNLDHYAVGSRNYSTFALFATLSASYIGGGYTFGLSEKVFTHGLIYTICLMGFSLQQLLVSIFIAPKMDEHMDALSVGDIMRKYYGKMGKVVVGIASMIVCAGILGAQVGATGYVFNLFLGLPQEMGIIIGCGIVLIYSVFGGMRSVIATDILQFMILIIMLPLTFIVGYFSIDINLVSLSASQQQAITDPLPLLAIVGLFFSLLIGEALVPPYVQRLLITKSAKKTSRGTLLSSMVSVPFFLLTGAIGLLAFYLNPGLDPNLSLPYVINEILPIGLKGLAIASIVAVIMSSADSFLNAASIAFVHDVLGGLRNDKLTPAKELRLARMVTLFIGIFAIGFALANDSVLECLLYAYNFWAPVVLIPLVMAIRGYTISPRAFLLNAIVSIFVVQCWNVFLKESTGFEGFCLGVLVNGLLFFTSHGRARSQKLDMGRQTVTST